MAKLKKKIIRKPRVSKLPKNRNSGTLTEMGFWNFIRSSLRRRTMFWKPILECKNKSRRAYTGPLKRQKFEYQCNECKNWFPDKQISVDHKIPAGELRCKEHAGDFIERLFCEVENLQCLCDGCHNKKTQAEKQFRTNKKLIDNQL